MKETQSINFTGNNVRHAIRASGFTKEQVVAHVQYKGLRFSLAGLDRIYRDELPVIDTKEIMEAIAEKCGCSLSAFAEEDKEAS